jgi:hypothetical protein
MPGISKSQVSRLATASFRIEVGDDATFDPIRASFDVGDLSDGLIVSSTSAPLAIAFDLLRSPIRPSNAGGNLNL